MCQCYYYIELFLSLTFIWVRFFERVFLLGLAILAVPQVATWSIVCLKIVTNATNWHDVNRNFKIAPNQIAGRNCCIATS